MAVTLVSSQQIDANVWRLEWSSDLPSPTFYIYVNGTLTSITTNTWQLLTVQPGSYVTFEVFDTPEDMPSAQWPANIVLGWAGIDGAAHYRIERYADGQWLEVDTVYANPTDSYIYRTAPVEDCTEHLFRCIAVASNGQESAAREWVIFMVRKPDVPTLSYAYDTETRTVTINA